MKVINIVLVIIGFALFVLFMHTQNQGAQQDVQTEAEILESTMQCIEEDYETIDRIASGDFRYCKHDSLMAIAYANFLLSIYYLNK